MSRQPDQQELGQKIRLYAHFIDMLTQQHNPDRNMLSKHALSLNALLAEWDKQFQTDGQDIPWARDIAKMYAAWTKAPEQRVISLDDQKDTDQTIFDVIQNRRSIRYWQPRAVGQNMLEEIIKAGTMAPSTYNLQAWKFIIQLNTPDNMIAGDSTNTSMLNKAPASIYIAIDQQNYEEKYAPAMDAALCAQNILLAAQGYGLGACLMYQGELIDQDQFRQRYNLLESFYTFCVIVMGYPASSPQTPGRVGLRECIIIDRMTNADI